MKTKQLLDEIKKLKYAYTCAGNHYIREDEVYDFLVTVYLGETDEGDIQHLFDLLKETQKEVEGFNFTLEIKSEKYEKVTETKIIKKF
jgi:hypothetical protein